MKKIFFSLLTISIIVFSACSNNITKKENEGHDVSKDTMQHAQTTDDKPLTEVAVTFTNVDAKAAAAVKSVIDSYLKVKNALAADNGNDAANAAEKMADELKGVDKSFFTPEQRKVFDDNADDLKEHAEHIGKNGNNIKHQRSHFSMMSEDIYDLAKAFGAGRPLYHYHCPMFNDGKGAMWLSEIKEVKNPYYGSEMPTCGSVEEVIK
ncbi:MAG: DUF3347 domain-containing protein [Sphingobacteriales bacterium]